MIAVVATFLAFCCCLTVGFASVIRDPIVLGNEVLKENNYAPLLGYRIGMYNTKQE